MDEIEIIRQKLQAALNPEHLEVIDQSSQHAEHLDTDREITHLKLIIISNVFRDMPKVERHRTVYKILEEELNSGLHAIVMDLSAERKDYSLNLSS